MERFGWSANVLVRSAVTVVARVYTSAALGANQAAVERLRRGGIYVLGLLSAACTLSVLLSVLLAAGQSSQPDWLVGTWKGAQGKGTWSHPTELTFISDGHRIKWTMVRKSDRNADFWEAGGSVAKSEVDSAELEGKYTGGTHTYKYMNGLLRLWLNRNGDSLSGMIQGADGTLWNLNLERVK
jgi:hypothetical protein